MKHDFTFTLKVNKENDIDTQACKKTPMRFTFLKSCLP